MKLVSKKLKSSDCCYCYVSKKLKKEIDKHHKKMQNEHNKKYGKRAGSISLSYASDDIVKRLRKWF